ncbi:MAG: hypothetical protein ACXQS5_00655 [Candidatus Methanospirareceae archaeon]
MSQNRSESEVTDRGITSIHGSTKVGEGDSLLALNKRIEIHDKKIDLLSSEISELKAAFEELSRLKEFLPLNIRVVEVRETTIEEAKKEILEYYEKHKDEVIYPDDIADELGLDLKITVKAVEELTEEGKLEEVK